jgi:hypothetical protein
MKVSKFLILAIFAFVLTASAGISFAQSTDRDRPTALTSYDLKGYLEENKDEHYYSFTAGPGDLTVTADIAPSKGSGTTNIAFELLNRNGADAIMCCEGVQGDFGATGRDVKTVRLTKRQTVILHTTNNGGQGTFRFRFTGSAVSGGIGVVNGDSGNGDNNDQDRTNNANGRGGANRRGGDPVDVPSSGILRIRMKDGSVKDIDLSRVRNISIH